MHNCENSFIGSNNNQQPVAVAAVTAGQAGLPVASHASMPAQPSRPTAMATAAPVKKPTPPPPPPPPPPPLQQQQQHPQQQERTPSATVEIQKTLAKKNTTTTTLPCWNRPPTFTNRAAHDQATDNNQQQQQQQQRAPINASNVTSTAEAVTEVPGAIKTTINIGFAMNHVNDQENLKQLSLAPVQVNEVEEMDTQEGECAFFESSLFFFLLPFFDIALSVYLSLSLSTVCSPLLSPRM